MTLRTLTECTFKLSFGAVHLLMMLSGSWWLKSKEFGEYLACVSGNRKTSDIFKSVEIPGSSQQSLDNMLSKMLMERLGFPNQAGQLWGTPLQLLVPRFACSVQPDKGLQSPLQFSETTCLKEIITLNALKIN